MRWKKNFVRFAIALLSFVVVVWAFLPLAAVTAITQRHIDYLGYATEDRPMQDIYFPEDYGLKANELRLLTQDGITLWASEVFPEAPKGVVIYLSGIDQPSVTYFYGHAKWMRDNGFASILLEVRGHGQSEGNKVCLGFEETADVRAAIDYIDLKRRYSGVPIILHGVSMGGAAAINAFGQIAEIDGLIAMSAYSSVEDIVIETMRGIGIPGIFCAMERPMIGLWLGVFFGKNAQVAVPLKQVENIGNRPALFIAAEGDTQVPPQNLTRLLKRAPRHVESWLKPSWEHFIVSDCDFIHVEQDEEYCNRILNFMQEVMADSETR